MSVKLMSAIFETEFRDLIDEKGNVTKASTAKLVLLALADHANDEGESAYPSVNRLGRKTALSDQTIRNTFDALKYNGIVFLDGISKLGTNNYTISLRSFPKLVNGEDGILITKPLEGGQMGEVPPSNRLPPPPNPFDPNHHLTTHESSSEMPKKGDILDGMIHYANQGKEEELHRVALRLEDGLRRGQFPETPKAQSIYKWILAQEAKGEKLETWIAWAADPKRFQYGYIYHKDPTLIRRDWPQVFSGNANKQSGRHIQLLEREEE